MPNRENDLLPVLFQCHETVELLPRPIFQQESGTDNQQAKATLGESLVNFLPQTVTKFQFLPIQPYFQSSPLKPIGQRINDTLFVLAGVTDKNIPALCR